MDGSFGTHPPLPKLSWHPAMTPVVPGGAVGDSEEPFGF